MRKRKWAGRVLLAVLLGIFLFPCRIAAGETDSYQNGVAEDEEPKDSYLEDMMGDMDFSELDEIFSEEFSGKQKEKITFSSIVDALLSDGLKGFDYSMLADWLKDAFLSEIEGSRTLLVEIVLLAVGFSILSNFSGAFRQAYVSELCFLLVYCVLAVMLLQSFYGFREIVTAVLNRSVEFMKALVPAFA